MTSWVIVNNNTGEPVFETFNKAMADKIREKSTAHKVVPILERLTSLNDK